MLETNTLTVTIYIYTNQPASNVTRLAITLNCAWHHGVPLGSALGVTLPCFRCPPPGVLLGVALGVCLGVPLIEGVFLPLYEALSWASLETAPEGEIGGEMGVR